MTLNTCPIVEGQVCGVSLFLNWRLTSVLNPTNSKYAPRKPHLKYQEKQWDKKVTCTSVQQNWTCVYVYIHHKKIVPLKNCYWGPTSITYTQSKKTWKCLFCEMLFLTILKKISLKFFGSIWLFEELCNSPDSGYMLFNNYSTSGRWMFNN